MTRLLTPTDAAERFPPGTSEKFIRALCQNGKLKAKRIGNRWFIQPQHLQAFLDAPEPVSTRRGR